MPTRVSNHALQHRYTKFPLTFLEISDKLAREIADLQDRLDKETKKREAAEKVAKELKALPKPTDNNSGKVPSEELKAVQTENDELRAKLEAQNANVVQLEKKKKQLEDELDEAKEQLEDEGQQREKLIKAKRQLEEEIDQLKER